MKKYLLIIAVLILLGTAKAADYSIGFVNKTVRVPYGDTVGGYMPIARVTFPTGASMVATDTEYVYGTGDVTVWELNSYSPGTYEIECMASSERYNVVCLETITVIIFDATPPEINCDDIYISYGEEFKISNYATAFDNVDFNIPVSTSKIDTSKIGESIISLYAVDEEGNKTTKEVVLTIYDKTIPIISLKNRQLYVSEDYNLIDNVESVNDNYTLLDRNQVKIVKEKMGNNYYKVTYIVEDESGNIAKEKVFLRYTYSDLPVIELKSIEKVEGLFDPLEYVTAYDTKDGDITSKITVIETNIKEKYCVYEICDSDGNYIREKIYFENLGKKNKLVFPEVNEQILDNNNTTVVEKKNRTYLIYIAIGAVAVSFATYKIIRHFKKKNDIIKSE